MQIRHGLGSFLSNFKGPCFYSSLNPQDHRYTPEIPDPAPFWSRQEAEFGGLQVFPVIRITVVCQVRVLPARTAIWVWRQTSAKTLHDAQRSWTHLFCVYFGVCGWQRPPQFVPMADDAITWGDRSCIFGVHLCSRLDLREKNEKQTWGENLQHVP